MIKHATLGAWLRWLETQHPKGQAGIELGLERVRKVLAALGHAPRLPFPLITVAGTNGKGSSVAMLEAVLLAAGYQVGTYTSPHLLRYNERVRLGGEPVADEVLIRAFARVEAARQDIPLTYFEFGTLAALEVLLEAQVEVAILEVGMGGRLDAVNVVDANYALITNVALDHTEYLGPDRESIGYEKAGILRSGQWAVVAEPHPPASVLRHAHHLGVRLWRRGQDFDLTLQSGGWRWVGPEGTYDLPYPALSGPHQIDNAAGVVMLLEGLRPCLPWSLTHLCTGLTTVRHPGRLQQLQQGEVSLWLDVAHNPAGAEALARALAAHPASGRTLAVFAALADKDAVGMARVLAQQVLAWYVAGLDGVRGRNAEQLAYTLKEAGIKVAGTWPSPRMAYNAAMRDAQPGDRVVVFGSFLSVADILGLLQSSVF